VHRPAILPCPPPGRAAGRALRQRPGGRRRERDAARPHVGV